MSRSAYFKAPDFSSPLSTPDVDDDVVDTDDADDRFDAFASSVDAMLLSSFSLDFSENKRFLRNLEKIIPTLAEQLQSTIVD